MTRLLIVTAVEAERDAVRAGLGAGRAPNQPDTEGADVVAVGVGPAAAAAGTARLLTAAEAAGAPYQAVICAGIGGGFAGQVDVGGIVLASVSIAADLGAASPDGFLALDTLGFGPTSFPADPGLLAVLRAMLPEAVVGPVLTVSTATGTAAGELAWHRHAPAAEGMEGFGVATAAQQAAARFAEVRTISNVVGPRDRDAWRIPEALAQLRRLGRALVTATPTDS